MGKILSTVMFLWMFLGGSVLASNDAAVPHAVMPGNPNLTETATPVPSVRKLGCDKVNDTLSYAATYPARAFCEPAAMRCFILKHLKEFPKDDPLRLELQDRVEAQVEYELAICEAFLKASNLRLPE